MKIIKRLLKLREALYSCQFNIGIISGRRAAIESEWDKAEDTGASGISSTELT